MGTCAKSSAAGGVGVEVEMAVVAVGVGRFDGVGVENGGVDLG